MAEGYQERQRTFLESLEIHACWLINRMGMAKKGAEPGDLLKFKEQIEPELRGDELKDFAKEAYAFAKSKFWTKIDGKYAKKTE